MIALPSGAPSAPGEGSRRPLLYGLTGFTVVLLVGVLFVSSLIPPTPFTQSGLVPSAGIPPWNNWTCNPNNPSPAALNIPVANPSVDQTAGTTFNVTYEFEVEGYVASDNGTNVYLPVTAAVLPTAPTGSLRVTIPEENVTITGPGWSSPALLSKSTKLTADESFSAANASLTTGKYAVMANATSGSLTLEFRWQWNFSSTTGGTNETGNWSVPSLTATSPYLPSIFYPAPYVGVVSTTSSPAVAGTDFVLELNGTVNNTSFRIVLEYPNNGSEIQSIWENTSAHATLFNATVPLSYRSGVPLPAGTYEIHVHDVCEAIVQMHSVVVVVKKIFNVTFAESGLPSATSWSVTLNGSQHTSTTTTITFAEPNGTYNYTITGISGWHQKALPYTGNVVVAGAVVTEPTLVFTQVTYSVTFTESGLPSSTEWWVNLTNGQTFSSTTTSLSFTEPNGTYAYAVATADKEYSPTVSGGSFGVSGAPVGRLVTFNLVAYNVTFTETGLPSGTTWYVNGTPWVSLSATVAGTHGTSVSANLTNGTYNFTVASGNKTWAPAYTSPFVVNGGPVPVPVTFTEVTYAVTFTESGLPSGTSWYVNLTGGPSNSSTGTTIGFFEPNGTYDYTVATADKEYSPTVSGGSFGVSGAPVGKSVTFSRATYAVTFTETGLPSGTTWYVNGTPWVSLSATVAGTHGTSVSLNLTNGTYNFIVASSNKTWAPAYTSPFVVKGGPVPVSVTFTQVTYAVTFTESGLPSGTSWYVNLTGGPSNSSTGTAIGFFEPNGTYDYTVATADKEYAPVLAGGSFGVSGASVSELVKFSRTSYSVSFTETGLPSGTTWYVNGSAWGSLSATVAGTLGTSMSTNLVNETYNFTAGSANKTWAPAYVSPFVVNGGPVTVPVAFTEVTYAVTLTETGLPSGTLWNVTIGSVTRNSTTSAVLFFEPNGTYHYTVATADKEFAPTLAGGSFEERGAPVGTAVTFSLVTYTVTFTETGLPSGTEWWVNLTNGQSFSSAETNLTLSEANGTYSYSASAPGYLNATGNLTVGGPTTAPVAVSFSSSSSSSSGLSTLDYVIIGVVVVAVAIALVVVLIRRRGKAPPDPTRAPSRP